MPGRSVLHGSLTIAAILLFAACSDTPLPTHPSASVPSSPFAGIQVTGPDAVASGQSAQFVATMQLTDGSTKFGTGLPSLRWISSNPSVVSVTTAGVAIARPSARGEAVITVDLIDQPSVRATHAVIVQPEGTYRMSGSVHEADAPTVPVVGARVEVFPGSSVAVTDSAGRYLLYGVPPGSTVRITLPGYAVLEQPLDVTANTTRDFGLNVDGPRFPINGPYTLSVDFGSSCSLDSALQHRTYDAVLTTTGTLVDVALTESRFRIDATGRGNRFQGHVISGGATFTLDDFPGYFDFQYPNVAERLADNTILVVGGVANTTGTAAGLNGTLAGDLMRFDSRFPTFDAFPTNGLLGYCSSSSMGFRLTPR
jgi:hypothetical protein